MSEVLGQISRNGAGKSKASGNTRRERDGGAFLRFKIDYGTCGFVHLFRRHACSNRRRRYRPFDVHIRTIFRKLVTEELLALDFDTRQGNCTTNKLICKFLSRRLIGALFRRRTRRKVFAIHANDIVRFARFLFNHRIPLSHAYHSSRHMQHRCKQIIACQKPSSDKVGGLEI
ncbi:hypothetical protein [uncultured Slackia sp.]|uniref:hypothetical protein n=1 Tax=uncultured Slackia sp. TaxID=665903 RepID=UPI0026DF826C|nr:hypothetical protein [uncultured Slackia sp.]